MLGLLNYYCKTKIQMASYNRGGVPVVAVAALALALISCAFAMEYVVGDGYCNPASWSPNVSCDYNTWALQNSFSVGDSLVFKFDPTQSNVVETSKDAYDGCVASGVTPTTTIRNHSSSPATIVLTQAGTSYLISTVGSACNTTTLQLAVTVTHDLASGPITQSPAVDSTPVDNTSATSPPAPSSSTDVPTGDATPATSAPAPSSSHHKSAVGPVVGVTVSVVVVVKVSLIIYCVMKRRRHSAPGPNHNVNNNNFIVNVHGNGVHQEINPVKNLNVQEHQHAYGVHQGIPMEAR